MNISELVSPSRIKVHVEAQSKEQVLTMLIDLLDVNGDLANKEQIAQTIFEREKLMSTGIGHGFALPHSKSPYVKSETAALITLKQPIEYDSLDNQPVNVVFMLLSNSANVSLHLKLLSKISRFIISEEFKTDLLKAKTPEEAYELFKQLDE